MKNYIFFKDAAKKVGSEKKLLEALRVGNAYAEGRFTDIVNQGEDYEGDAYATIPSICWQDYEYRKNGDGVLFHEQWLQGYHAIRFSTEQFITSTKRNDGKSVGGRPPALDSKRLFAEITAHLLSSRKEPIAAQPANGELAKWRKKLQEELPYLIELDEVSGDDSPYHEKTLDSLLKEFLGFYHAAMQVIDPE